LPAKQEISFEVFLKENDVTNINVERTNWNNFKKNKLNKSRKWNNYDSNKRKNYRDT
jgi:long-subunit fatty acid transport protein